MHRPCLPPPQPPARPARARILPTWWWGGVALLAGGCQVAPLGEGSLEPGSNAPRPEASAQAPAPTMAVATAPALAPAAPAPAGVPAAPGLLDLLDRPAERALLAGLRAYDDGQYAESESQLKRALDGNLRSPRDRAAAHKQLAFIYCTSGRTGQCELEFRMALRSDPGFTLTRGEAGHPMWGPVYKRVKGQ
jgi:hypothetical protein